MTTDISGDSMTGGGAVYGDHFVADFRVAQTLPFEVACKYGAVPAYCAAGRMLILIAAVQAFMPAGITIVETRQLRESLRNFLRHLISLSYFSRELFRRQRRLQTIEGLWFCEMSRDRSFIRRGGSLRLILRGVVTLNLITG